MADVARPEDGEQDTASSVTWVMRGMCVVIVDRADGATIMLEPEEAERLRQWLAEVL